MDKTDVLTTEELTNRVSPVLKKYHMTQAILFGSYSKGTANEKSDVDLVVDSNLHGLQFVGLIQDMSDALSGKQIDLIDVSHIESGSPVEQEYKTEQAELSPIHAEVKKLWQIKYKVEQVIHEQERQNTVTRQKKQEIEH